MKLIIKKKIIPLKYIDIITYQILNDMIFCQKENIIHRDLKPSNIVVNSKGKIRISNFGVSTIIEGSWAQKTLARAIKYKTPERIEEKLKILFYNGLYFKMCDS